MLQILFVIFCFPLLFSPPDWYLGNKKADQAAKSALNLPILLPTHYHILISHLLLKNTYSPGGNTFCI